MSHVPRLRKLLESSAEDSTTDEAAVEDHKALALKELIPPLIVMMQSLNVDVDDKEELREFKKLLDKLLGQPAQLKTAMGKWSPSKERTALKVLKRGRTESVESDENEQYQAEIVDAMARALFVSAWADNEEEEGNSHSGEELMDVAPKTSAAAKRAAEKLAKDFEKRNGVPLHALMDKAAESELSIIDSKFAKDFGHDLAMMALGTGVSWFDDHAKFPLKVPHTEFSYG